MKAMKSLVFLGIAVLSSFELTTSIHSGASSMTRETGQVKGAVVDFLTGAPIRRATILLESDKRIDSAVTDEKGTYRVELPIDSYRISVKRLGFCSSRRAPFRIPALADTTLDFMLVPCGTATVAIVENGRYKGETTEEKRPFNYESLNLPSSQGPAQEILIRFPERTQGDGSIDYEGAAIKCPATEMEPEQHLVPCKFLPVMVTYDLLTIYADHLRFLKNTFEMEATGHVLIEDGRTRSQGKTARIRFEGGKATVALTP